MKQETKSEKHSKSIRRQAQLIRRNMITRVKPSGKVYKREKYAKED